MTATERERVETKQRNNEEKNGFGWPAAAAASPCQKILIKLCVKVYMGIQTMTPIKKHKQSCNKVNSEHVDCRN